MLTSVIINEVGGILSNVSAHSIIQGGPLVLQEKEKQILPILITEHDKFFRKKALYNEIRNLNDKKDTLDYLSNYKFEGELNFLINLNQNQDGLWQQIHQSRREKY